MILTSQLVALLAFWMPGRIGHPIARPSAAKAAPLSCLIVGGGPNRENNGATIEAHVRFVSSVLPRDTYRRVLFADGSKKNPTVKIHRPYYFGGKEATILTIFADVLADALNTEENMPLNTPGMAVLNQVGKNLTVDVDDLTLSEEAYRAPKLPALHGPAVRTSVSEELNKLAGRPPVPVLIYFAGHGEGGPRDDRQNTAYDLWSDDRMATGPADKSSNTLAELSEHHHEMMQDAMNDPRLTVRELAASMAAFPADRPVALVMVQCYGGGFANLLFEKGDATGAVSDRPLCGFFATTFDHLAAGCGVESRLSNQDFTATFFAALSGHDAEGKSVTASDYDGDGRISMYEAYLYSLINDSSIDIPIATSDIMLRHLVPATDSEIALLNDSKIRDIAAENDSKSPGHAMQTDVLEHLKTRIRELSALPVNSPPPDTLAMAWEEIKPRQNPVVGKQSGGSRSGFPRTPTELLASLQTIAPQIQEDARIKPLLKKHPVLTPPEKAQITQVLIPKMETAIHEATRRSEEAQLRIAYLRRYWEFSKTVYLQKRLRDAGTVADIAQMDRLRERENANPLLKPGK